MKRNFDLKKFRAGMAGPFNPELLQGGINFYETKAILTALDSNIK